MTKFTIRIWEDFATGQTLMTVVDRRKRRISYWWDDGGAIQCNEVPEGALLYTTRLGDLGSGTGCDFSKAFLDLVEVWNAGGI